MANTLSPFTSTSSQAIHPDTHYTIDGSRRVLIVSWTAMAVLVLLSLLPVTIPNWVLYAPFILSFIVLGLPHGATDHWVLITLRKKRFSLRSLFRAIVPYIGLAGLYLVLWWVAPLLSFFLFILITWFHWGQGDLHSITTLTGRDHLTASWQLVLAMWIRGGLPMLVPLLAFPEVYAQVALDVVGNLGVTDIVGYAFLFASPFRLAAGLVFGLSIVVYLVATFRNTHAWCIDASEIALLAIAFSTVHPILAIGIYFCLWHSMRHILRIMKLDKRSPVLPNSADGTITAPIQSVTQHPSYLLRFVLHALPTTAAAITLLIGLYYLVPHPPDSVNTLIGLYLVLIAILTLPHIWVVCLMDRDESIWSV